MDLQNKNTEPLNLEVACKKKIRKKGHSNINIKIKHNLYTWITSHPQVVQSPSPNDCLKVTFEDQT